MRGRPLAPDKTGNGRRLVSCGILVIVSLSADRRTPSRARAARGSASYLRWLTTDATFSGPLRAPGFHFIGIAHYGADSVHNAQDFQAMLDEHKRECEGLFDILDGG